MTQHHASGSFVLQHTGQHTGLMRAPRPAEAGRPPRGSRKVAKPHFLQSRGDKQLTITVVPDSVTEGLPGLEGRLDIRIAQGQHFYAFDNALP